MPATEPVTRADIERKLGEIQDALGQGAEAGKDAARLGALAGGAIVVALVYLLGRRHGKKRRTIVEIRRV